MKCKKPQFFYFIIIIMLDSTSVISEGYLTTDIIYYTVISELMPTGLLRKLLITYTICYSYQ